MEQLAPGSDEKRTVTSGDAIRAIAELNKMQGDYAPTKTEVKDEISFYDAVLELTHKQRGYAKKRISQ